MTSKTTIKWIDGKEYRIELVETKKQFTPEQSEFISSLPRFMSDLYALCKSDFNDVLKSLNMVDQWQNFLITEARKRGFISGCHIKTAHDIDIMKSNKLKLESLSKLATDGRKSIVIYDNGRWCAEAIPEVKKYWWNEDRVKCFNNANWTAGESLTRDEMSQVKCKPEKKPIFTTEDGVKLFELYDKCFWLRLSDMKIGKQPFVHEGMSLHKDFKYFTTEKAAQDWSEKQEPATKTSWEEMCYKSLKAASIEEMKKPYPKPLLELLHNEEKQKSEPEKYNIEDLKNIICDVTFLLNQHKKYITITSNQAKLIREILNDYLK